MKKLAKSSWVCGSSWCGDLVGLLIGIDQGSLLKQETGIISNVVNLVVYLARKHA